MSMMVGVLFASTLSNFFNSYCAKWLKEYKKELTMKERKTRVVYGMWGVLKGSSIMSQWQKDAVSHLINRTYIHIYICTIYM